MTPQQRRKYLNAFTTVANATHKRYLGSPYYLQVFRLAGSNHSFVYGVMGCVVILHHVNQQGIRVGMSSVAKLV